MNPNITPQQPRWSGDIASIVRIALIAIGIGLALYTQLGLSQELTRVAGTQFAIAILLVVAGAFGVMPTRGSSSDASNTVNKTKGPVSMLWVLSWLLIAASIYFFFVKSNWIGWLLHFAAMISFLLCVIVPDLVGAQMGVKRHFTSRRLVIVISLLAGLIALAAVARMQFLREFPEGVWFDEGTTGLIAIRMLQDPSYRPIYLSETQLPAHFNYLVALSFWLFGVDIWSIRLVPTVFVVTAIGFTFLLMRRWFNLGLAVAATLVLVFSRWSLTLSRFGVNGHLSLLFVCGSLYFFDRAWRHRKLRDFAIGGMFFGMGLNFYYAYRLFAVAACVFVVIQATRWLIAQLSSPTKGATISPAIRRAALPVLAALFGTLVTITPIAQYAAANPEDFFARTSTVSIFTKRDEPDLIKALITSSTKHALMFNVRGDANGRHNIPGEPMLDPVTAALALCGIGLALSQLYRPHNLLILLSFAALMMAGILSVDFEAPQGYRTNLVTLTIAYFAILPIATLWKVVSHLSIPAVKAALYVVLVAASGLGVLAIGQSNLTKFYVDQRQSNSSWIVQSVGETFAGREMNLYAGTHRLFVSDLFANSPTQRFVAPNVTDFKIYTPNDLIELPSGENRNVAYILDESKEGVWKQLQRLFPNATYRALVGPSGGKPIAYSAAISEKDVGAIAGVTAKIRSVASPSGDVITVSLPRLAADWRTVAPMADPFEAEFLTTLAVPKYGDYQFALSGSPEAQVFVDEFDVSGKTTKLSKGNHTLRVVVPPSSTRRELRLTWQGSPSPQAQMVPDSAFYQPLITNDGLQGDYFRSDSWAGAPANSQIDPQIGFYFHNLPLPRPYTVQWKGKVFAEKAGRYTFGTLSVDESLLSIDGTALVENTLKGGRKNGTLDLTQGWHDVNLRFADRTGYTQVYLFWQPPGGADEVIPQAYLRPPMGRDPAIGEMITRLQVARSNPSVTVELVQQEPAKATVPFLPIKPPELALPAATSATQVNLPSVVENRTSLPATTAGLDVVFEAKSVVSQVSSQQGLMGPKAIASKDGKTWYVADSGANRIYIYDETGAFVSEIAQPVPPITELADIAIGDDGVLLILDADQALLRRFNPTSNSYIEPISFIGFSAYKPRGLSLDATGNIYIADTGGARAIRMSSSGQLLNVYGEKGSGAGALIEPNHLLLAPNGLVYVVDMAGKRIAAYQADGAKYVGDFSIPGGNAANGSRLALGPENTLLVSIPELHEIHRYGLDGKRLQTWGGFGDGLGKLRLPMGISIVKNQAWIADFGNKRLQLWSLR